MFLANSSNAAELNGLSLSDLITLGIPNAEITLSRTGIVAFAKVDLNDLRMAEVHRSRHLGSLMVHLAS